MGGQIGLIVVNYASHRLIEANLGVTDGLSVIVVDNFSTPAERVSTAALCLAKGWECVPSANDGFGAGVNLGVATATERGCAVVVVANPDLAIDRSVVVKLAAAALARPDDIVSPLVLSGDGTPWGRLGTIDIPGGRLWSTRGTSDQPAWISGACFAVSTRTWQELGGFSDDYFMYWEDVDLSLRCQRAGGNVIVLPDLTAVHEVGGTQGSGRSALYYYYNCRNRLVFAAKLLTSREQLKWLLLTPADIRRVARRDSALTRWQRLRRAFPSCLHGASVGAWWMLTHRFRGRASTPSVRVRR